MPRLLKRPEAESDLDEIWWYIAQDSPHNADRFLDRIQERCLGLTDFPQMGTRRDELKAGLRSQPVGNYLIFYFPLEDGIDIVRVLHGSRDVDAIFHPDD
jgi:toxin ParE1/3/4